MARQLRIEYPCAFYHIIQRGIERKSIFSLDKDKEKFFSYLNASHLSYKAVFHTYTLMDNHYHLILETPNANLSKIMHYINTSYAAYYNAKHKRRGPLYQGRFKAILVDKDEYLHYLSCYIHLNPVRAGIAKSPEEYQYSSHKYFISDKKPPQWLNTRLVLSMFNKNLSKAKRLYKQFVTDNIGKEEDIIKNNTKSGFVLGNDDFFEYIKDKVTNIKKDTEIPVLKDIRQRKEFSPEQIKTMVQKHLKDDKRLTRSLSIYLSRKYTQKTLDEIAIFYGKIQYSAVSQVYRRIEKRRQDNNKLAKLLLDIESEIEKSKM